MRSLAFAIIIGTLMLGTTTPARAQSDNKALAEQLFTQGKDLAKAGDWAAACPKFEASLRYDPQLGTRLNLATCYEKVGKLASAWALYKESVDLARKAGDDKRRIFAAKQVTTLEPRLPRLSISAAATPGLTVTRNGTTVDAVVFGTPAFVDPGEYEVVASAPGYEPYTTKVIASEGNLSSVTLPELTPAKPEPEDDRKPPEDDGKPPPELLPEEPSGPPPSKMRRNIGLGLDVAGLVTMGVGIYFGKKTIDKLSSAEDACGGDLFCDTPDDLARSQGFIRDAESASTKFWIFTGVGSVMVVTGVTLMLTAPKERRSSSHALRLAPSVGPDRAALVLGGRF